MPYKLIETESYKKRAVKFFRKHPDLLERYGKTLSLLELDPFHPSLRLHKLQGTLRKYHSVSITLQYRIVIDFLVEGDSILLLNVGSHDEVYS